LKVFERALCGIEIGPHPRGGLRVDGQHITVAEGRPLFAPTTGRMWAFATSCRSIFNFWEAVPAAKLLHQNNPLISSGGLQSSNTGEK
jgi:hypothetical protein